MVAVWHNAGGTLYTMCMSGVLLETIILSILSQIHDLAEELKDFRPEKADEVLSKEEQRQLTDYINRHVCV